MFQVVQSNLRFISLKNVVCTLKGLDDGCDSIAWEKSTPNNLALPGHSLCKGFNLSHSSRNKKNQCLFVKANRQRCLLRRITQFFIALLKQGRAKKTAGVRAPEDGKLSNTTQCFLVGEPQDEDQRIKLIVRQPTQHHKRHPKNSNNTTRFPCASRSTRNSQFY